MKWAATARTPLRVLPLLCWTLNVISVAAIDVQRIQLSFEHQYSFPVNSSVEYIFDFVPINDEGAYPTRLWVRASGGELSRPLLLTARQLSGAATWQLPYAVGTAGGAADDNSRTLYELTRTLCSDGYRVTAVNSPDCEEDPSVSARGAFSLHVSSACGTTVTLDVRATPLRDWRLPFQQEFHFSVDQATPRAHLYEFSQGQDRVLLVVSSEDDVCATIVVQNNVCPVGESLSEVGLSGLRMTVLRSGAAQLTRRQFPNGFIVVGVVQVDDVPCIGEAAPGDPDWLWSAVLGIEDTLTTGPPPRRKNFTITIMPSLSRAQYAIASVVTVVVFAMFYVAFGALLLARRWPAFGKLVAPAAVLAESTDIATGAEASAQTRTETDAAQRRRRRGSNTTFDSGDDSNSEGEDDPSSAASIAPAAPPVPVSNAGNGRVSQQVTEDGVSAVNGVRSVTIAEVDGAVPMTTTPISSTPLTSAPATSTPVTSVPVTSTQVTSAPVTSVVATEDGSRPFGLPVRLTLAALARHRACTLAARSDRYRHTLYTVAVFYSLPVIQFVATFQFILNLSGSLDMCYYNFLCAHPAGAISDFNHVFSNAGYLLLGALLLLQIRRRRARRRRHPRHEEYGIPAHYGLLEALGAGMMVVALLSASYHVCPNQLNFQFDTSFMYVLAVLSMVKIYQARHPDINARAHATFGVLSVLIALVVWGVLDGGALFWSLITVLHVFTFLLLSLRIYYVGQFTLDKRGLAMATRGLRTLPATRPLYSARLVLVVLANAVNWAFAMYGLLTMPADFASHLLSVLLCNELLYIVFYLIMKLLHGERLRWYAWMYLATAALTWAPALYFFTYGSSDWSSTPAISRQSNHECKVLQFYDSHDLWHFLSAIALYLTFNAMLTWDDGLAAVKRTDIAVF